VFNDSSARCVCQRVVNDGADDDYGNQEEQKIFHNCGGADAVVGGGLVVSNTQWGH
jgi:hypothetical protein